MFKNFKKKSLKAKIGIIAFIVVMIALVTYVLYSNFKPEDPKQFEISVAQKGTIVDTLDVSGKVSSTVTDSFEAIQGVKVNEVFVNVGDRVSKGDQIASFDASSIVEYLVKAENDYNDALKEYNDAVESNNNAVARRAEIDNQIATKKAEIAKLEKEIEELEMSTETRPLTQTEIALIVAQMKNNGDSDAKIQEFLAIAPSLQIPISYEAVAVKQTNIALLNSDIASLQAEKATITTTDESVLNALKKVAEVKKAEYEKINNVYNSLNNGWYAQNDGIVTVVNIKAGQPFVPVAENSSSLDISALLGNQTIDSETMTIITELLGGGETIPTGVGVKVESYDDLIITVTVGKADLLKVKVGMKATVISLDSEYEAEVIYVSATATEQSGMDIGSIAGSLIGGSGNTSGAEIKIKVKNPDEKVVIGFDVDVKIELETLENVLKVPVESVIYNNGTYSVYVYNEQDGTVEKRIITKGILDNTSYQVIDGLSEGEKVVRSPDPTMEDGTIIAEKKA